METTKLTFINRFMARLFALLVAFLAALIVGFMGHVAQAELRSCQNVFQPGRYQSIYVRDARALNEVTEMLREAGFHEFKEGGEGVSFLERTARQNPEGLRYYIKALKRLERNMTPRYPQDIVRAIEQLMSAPMSECRGGSCTVAVKTNHSCTTGNCNSRLIVETSLTGEQQLIFQYQEVISLFGHPLRVWMSEPVMSDNLTGALTPKGVGVRAVNDIVHAAQSRQQPTAFIFIDVNDLSKVNYFRNAFLDGDAYIRAVGRVLKSSLRPGDTFVRMGGDEFVLVLDRLSPDDVRVLSQRLIEAVANDPEAALVFHKQWQFIEGKIAEVATARELNELDEESEKLIGALKEELKRKARERNRTVPTFQEFQSDAIEVLQTWLQKQKVLLAPNVSVGSTFIRPGDDLDSAVYRASCNANLCKKLHKEALGADARKYGGSPENEELILQNASSGARPLPQALLPDHVKVDGREEAPTSPRQRLSLEELYR